MINVEIFYGRQTTAISCREDEEELNELPSLEKRPAVKIDKKFLFCQRCGKKTSLKEVLLPNVISIAPIASCSVECRLLLYYTASKSPTPFKNMVRMF